MTTKVQRWGHSLSLRIPKRLAQAMEIDAGSVVELRLRDGMLQVTSIPVSTTLESLLAGVTRRNIHAVQDQ
jgi:antitoxin MazE